MSERSERIDQDRHDQDPTAGTRPAGRSPAARGAAVATRTALLPARVALRTARMLLMLPGTLLRAARHGRVADRPDEPAGQALLAAQRTSPARSSVNRQLHRPGEGRLAVAHYDELGATDAATAVRTLTSATEVDAVLRHERANRNRKTVINAVNQRLRQLNGAAQRA